MSGKIHQNFITLVALGFLTLSRQNKSQSEPQISEKLIELNLGRGFSRNWSNFCAPPTIFASWHFADVSQALLIWIVSKSDCIKRKCCLSLQYMILMIERNACKGRGES